MADDTDGAGPDGPADGVDPDDSTDDVGGDDPSDGLGGDDPSDGLDPDDLTDDEKRAVLRAVAEELRGEDSRGEQVAAMLYRVSDVYDPAEDTTPRDVYVNMRTILRVKEGGGRDPEPEGL